MTGPHTVHLSRYVDESIDDVLDQFAAPGVDGLLASALSAALGDAEQVTVHASAAARVSAIGARVTVTWRVAERSGRVSEGTAAISLLLVQSGREPMTEVLVAVPVDEGAAKQVAVALRRFLDELADRLTPVAA